MRYRGPSDKPLVLVVIPTKNAGKFIKTCLRSLKKQTCQNNRVIVVDNFSGDGTVKFAEDYGAKVFLLKAGRAEAKNFGAMKSCSEYIFFIDSDMELTERVIQECVELLEIDPKIGGIIIPERSVGDSFWVRVRDFERNFYVGTEIESARFFRRSLWENAGGFDEGLVFYEESTLPHKVEALDYDVKARIKAEILHHEDDFSLLKWLKKKFDYGKTGWKYRQKYGGDGKKKMSLLYRIGLFMKDRRFYSKPIQAMGVLILKSLEFLSVVLGYIIGRIMKLERESSVWDKLNVAEKRDVFRSHK